MELPDLRILIESALLKCQRILFRQPEIVLSEADLERLVAWSIMKMLKQNNYKKPQSFDYTVHSQITHYSNGRLGRKRRPDLLLLTNEGLRNAQTPKGFIYNDNSFAIELKYIRNNDTGFEDKVRRDFNKRKELSNRSWLYIVVLIETDDVTKFDDIKAKIEKMRDNRIKRSKFSTEDNLNCFVLRKKKVNFDII